MDAGVSAELSDADFDVVQQYIDFVVEDMLGQGLRLELEHDFDTYVHIRESNVDGWVYPSFDPRFSDLSSSALWIRAIDRNEETVATIAARIFRTHDFFDLMRRETLWFGKASPQVRCRCPVTRPSLSEIAGVIGHTGGLWIHPSWRGHGIAPILPRFSRALMLRNWSIDHDTALVFERIARTTMPTRGYGYKTVDMVVDGFFPPTGRPERVYMCHIARADALHAMCATVGEPGPNTKQWAIA